MAHLVTFLAPFKAVVLLSVLLLLSATALVQAAAPASAGDDGLVALSARTSGVRYVQAPFCCPGCSTGSAKCCCAPPAKHNVKTMTVWKATKTSTVRRTVTQTVAPRQKQARALSEPIQQEPAESEHIDADSQIGLLASREARNLCPVCPSGVSLSKNNGGGSAVYCCKPRVTTKTFTLARTTTVRKTMTITVRRAVATGLIYYDNNHNNIYDNPPDAPIANKQIYLVLPARTSTKQARAGGGDTLCSTTTDNFGNFRCLIPVLPNTTINVVLASKPNEPVQVVTTSETGYANATIPVVRPPVPTNISMTVAGNKATIVGKGEAGMKITVFDDNGKLFGSAVVQPDGSFSVTTTYLGSGSYPMNITQTDDKGVVSDTVQVGTAVILNPPGVTKTSVSGNVATVEGSGAPGATVKLYSDGALVGTVAVDGQGKFSVQSSALALGSHALTATQEDSAGVSDVASAGSVTVNNPSTTKKEVVTTAAPAGTSTSVAAKQTSSAAATLPKTTTLEAVPTTSANVVPTTSAAVPTTSAAVPTTSVPQAQSSTSVTAEASTTAPVPPETTTPAAPSTTTEEPASTAPTATATPTQQCVSATIFANGSTVTGSFGATNYIFNHYTGSMFLCNVGYATYSGLPLQNCTDKATELSARGLMYYANGDCTVITSAITTSCFFGTDVGQQFILLTSYEDPTQPCSLTNRCPELWFGSCPASCPNLYVWDGSKYNFETDMASGGKLNNSVGKLALPGDYYTWETVPRVVNSEIQVIFREDKDESDYIDEHQVFSIDLPLNTSLYPLVNARPYMGKTLQESSVLVSQNSRPPVSAIVVQTGQNILADISNPQDDQVAVFGVAGATDSGVTTLELDLGSVDPARCIVIMRSRKMDPGPKIFQPASIWNGSNWQQLPAQYNITALNMFWATVAVNLTGVFPTSDTRVRFNLGYKTAWDWIAIDTDTSVNSLTYDARSLDLVSANLGYSGPGRMVTGADGLDTHVYTDIVSGNFGSMKGNYTRYGNVSELLTATDSLYSVIGQGDEIRLRYSEPNPTAPAGYSRTYVSYLMAYYKTNKRGTVLEPYPFVGMPSYPYNSSYHYPTGSPYDDYRASYQTRVM